MEFFFKVTTEYDETDFKELLVRFCIWEKINLNNTSTVSINYIRQRCGYSSDNRNKSSFTTYIRKTLQRLMDRNEIELIYGNNVLTATGTSYLEFKILDKFNYISTKTFSKLTVSAFNTLMSLKCSISKSTLLKVYTYIRSSIIENDQQAYGFYGSIKLASRILGLNRKTVDVCISAFVENGLFIKHSTGSCYVNGEPRNVPNIYVLPDDKANKNIDALIIELKNKYKVDEFAPVLGAGQENSNYEKGETNK